MKGYRATGQALLVHSEWVAGLQDGVEGPAGAAVILAGASCDLISCHLEQVPPFYRLQTPRASR